MRIGILTGGGDCPGLNPAIKSVCRKASDLGFEVVGLHEGWKSVVDSTFRKGEALTSERVRHIDRYGGTILGTSRTNPFAEPKYKALIRQWWKEIRVDALVAIGGEDTLGVASRLYEEFQFPVVGIPKTIDGDLSGTEYTLGLESAVAVITNCVDALRSTAESHSRIFVVEAMGRHAGHLTLKGGLSSGASVILIPEHDFKVEKVKQILLDRKKRGCRYSIVLISEGAKPIGGIGLQEISKLQDSFGHTQLGGIGNWLCERLKGPEFDVRAVVLSHLQRAGAPVAYDRRMGLYFGIAAVEAIRKEKFGQMAALKGGRVTLVSLKEAVGKLRTVDISRYDTDNYWGKLGVL